MNATKTEQSATNPNLEAKDVLAKVLASENITIIHKAKAKTAKFNTDNRVLTLPIYDGKLQSRTITMLIAHEVGHALWTPKHDVVMPAINLIDSNNPKGVKRYLNVIEDVRIERKIKTKYRGLAVDFKAGYAEVMERDLFQLKRVKDINSLYLIDKINIFFKVGDFNLGINFTPEEMVFVKAASKAETWKEVVDVTKAIYDWQKNKQDDQDGDDDEDEDEDEDQSQDENGDGESSEGSSDESDDEKNSSDGQGQESDDANDFDEDSDSSDEDGDSDESKQKSQSKKNEEKKNNKGSNNRSQKQNNTPEPLDSQTQSAWEENEESFADAKAKDNVYINVPFTDPSPYIVPFAMFMQQHELCNKGDTYRKDIEQIFKIFKQSNKDKVMYLVNEFNRKKAADERVRETHSRTGMIDTGKLYSYKFADDIFRTNITKQNAKNHSLVFFLDCSCSMQNNIMGTIEQLLCQVMFCRAVGIPFECYTFGSNETNMKTKPDDLRNSNTNTLLVNPRFVMRQYFKANMSAQEFDKACYNIFKIGYKYQTGHGKIPSGDSLGYWTPLTEVAIMAPYIVDNLKAATKTQICHVVILTDGAGNSENTFKSENGSTTNINPISNNYHVGSSKTKKYYHFANCENICDSVIRVAGDMINSNMIGFFITGASKADTVRIASLQCKSKNKQEITKELNETGYIRLENPAYTEYYMIPGSTDLKVANTKVTSKNLNEVNSERKKSRILLSHFIGLIAK